MQDTESGRNMSGIFVDEELLEWAKPVLMEFLLPSTIITRMLTYLSRENVQRIRQAERREGSATAVAILVDCLQAACRKSSHSLNSPIFTALVDVLRERGYGVLDRLFRNPEGIIGWQVHRRLFEVYLPTMLRISVKEFMDELVAADLFSCRGPEYELVMATVRNEGDEMAMLEILNVIWRKKHNWSELFVGALRKHKERGGAVDGDMIDTMESKIKADRSQFQTEAMSSRYVKSGTKATNERKLFSLPSPWNRVNLISNENVYEPLPSSASYYDESVAEYLDGEKNVAAHENVNRGVSQDGGLNTQDASPSRDNEYQNIQRFHEDDTCTYQSLYEDDPLPSLHERRNRLEIPEFNEDTYQQLPSVNHLISSHREHTNGFKVPENLSEELNKFHESVRILVGYSSKLDEFNESMRFFKKHISTINKLNESLEAFRDSKPLIKQFNDSMKVFNECSATINQFSDSLSPYVG